MLHVLKLVRRLPIAKEFRYTVDFNRFPDYCEDVAYPMDLKTIVLRLEHAFYRRPEALAWDISRIYNNAVIYNGATSDIAQDCHTLKEALTAVVQDCAPYAAATESNLSTLFPSLTDTFGDDVEGWVNVWATCLQVLGTQLVGSMHLEACGYWSLPLH